RSELQDDLAGFGTEPSGQGNKPGYQELLAHRRVLDRGADHGRVGTTEYGDELLHEQSDRLVRGAVADPDPYQHHHVAHATGHGQCRYRPLVGPPWVGELPLLV